LKEAPGLRAQKDELLGLIFNLTGKACYINSASMMIERNTNCGSTVLAHWRADRYAQEAENGQDLHAKKPEGGGKLKNTNIEKIRQYLFNWVFNTRLKHMFQFKKF